MLVFRIHGTVREAETDLPLPGFFVKAYDKDLVFDDLMGTAWTGTDGRFTISSEPGDFRDFFEQRPDIYLKVFAADAATLLYSSARAVRWRAGPVEEFDVRIPRADLGAGAPARGIVLSGDDGEARPTFEVGEPLALAAIGLRPGAAHSVEVRDGDRRLLFEQRLLADRAGTIATSVIWPQLGLDDPRTGELTTLDQAEARWAGRALTVVVRDGKHVVAEHAVRFPERFTRPVLLGTDEAGVVRNGFVAGAADVILSGRRLPWHGAIRVFMGARRHDWRVGDAFVPAPLASGRPAFIDVDIGSPEVRARVARAREVLPGAYDFIVRRVRYGYEDDEDFALRATDLVAHRLLTGLVVREEFMRSKFARGGCVNLQPISGRKLVGSPYFQYTDVFPIGAEVWGALDPGALAPEQQSKMVAFYVVAHKTSAQWSADPGLSHLPVLGGNAATVKLKTQIGCINANARLLWPAASQVGEYDVIADFGNNTSDATAFAPDDELGPTTIDIVDGYVTAGFRVVSDPTTSVEYANVGTFEYDLPAEVVTDDFDAWDPYLGQSGGTTTLNVARRAVVYFPSDSPGATTAAQISSAQPSYPLFVAVHGNSGHSNSYQGYNYLLEHLARNGFIAASIHSEPGMKGRGRAELLFKHLAILRGGGPNGFGAKAANSIAIMGHSRGGEAVVKAARMNQQQALGHNIAGIVSLAPTDKYGRETLGPPWAIPYLVIYGSMDGDVAGGSAAAAPMQTGFSLYDRAGGAPKSMVFAYGAIHDRFNTVWGDDDLGFGKLGSNDLTQVINADAHEKIAKAYMNAFGRLYCRGEQQWAGLFRGEWNAPAVEAADAGKVRIYVQYRDTTRTDVDTFDGAHTPTSWQVSSAGTTVDDAGTLPVDPSENQLNLVDAHSPHDTGGLLLRWDGTADKLSIDMPGGTLDVRAYEAVQFRVGQKVGSASNPSAAQDLYVTLTDAAAQSRSIRASKFAEIPRPHQRDFDQFTKSAMRTVRIPLHAWTIKVAGAVAVDLASVARLTFDFGINASGEIEIDDVEFTN